MGPCRQVHPYIWTHLPRHRNTKNVLIKLLNQRKGRKTHGEQFSLSSPFLHPTIPSVLPNKSHMTGKCCEPSGCDDLIRANIPTEFQQVNSLFQGFRAESSMLFG